MLYLILLLLLFIPAQGQAPAAPGEDPPAPTESSEPPDEMTEDNRLLNVDPLLLRSFVAPSYEYKWRLKGRNRQDTRLRAQWAFGPQQTQAVLLNVPYVFFQGEGRPPVESMDDVEMTYIHVFDPEGEILQAVGFKVEFPTNGDPEVGGDWTLQSAYGFRWKPDKNVSWTTRLHYNNDLTENDDYLEGDTTLGILLPADLVGSVGGRVRYLLPERAWAVAAQWSVGRKLDDQTNLNLSFEQPLNVQARSTFEVFRATLSITRRL